MKNNITKYINLEKKLTKSQRRKIKRKEAIEQKRLEIKKEKRKFRKFQQNNKKNMNNINLKNSRYLRDRERYYREKIK